MATYKVLRRHDGDRPYHKGDTRDIAEADAKHLVDLGVLQKAEPPAKNKAEEPPKNKGAKS